MAAVFALVLLGGLGIFIWRAQPVPPSQEVLAADFAKGEQYQHGTGVTLDYAQALSWYRKAAAGGHAGAAFQIGRMTAAGQGIVRDPKAAHEWFLRAAEQGLPDAQLHLAKQLMDGTGTPDGRPDPIEALKWLLLGTERVDEGPDRQVARATTEELAAQLSAEDRAEAERRAKTWRQEHAER